jgi:hypothetical protein
MSYQLPGDTDLSLVGIYNVLHYGALPGPGNDQTNQNAFNAAIAAALANGGGTILIPAIGTYPIHGPIAISASSEALVFAGTGQGDKTNPLLQVTNGADLFQVNNPTAGVNDANVGGVTFQDLHIQYVTNFAGAAIHVVNGQNVRLLRVVLHDCPRGAYFEESLQCSMIDCTAIYPSAGLSPTCVTIGHPSSDNNGIETYIAGCVFRNDNNTGVAMQIYNAEHVRVVNTRMEAFQQGVLVTPSGVHQNVKKVYFGNVSCFAESNSAGTGAGVLIQPQNGRWVGQVTFDSCELDAPDNGTSYLGAGVIIDPVNGAGGGGVIDQVRFKDCHVCKWPGPGLAIYGGNNSSTPTATNVEILGGYYSLNGGSPASGLPSAGIAILGGTNGPQGVRISGATCNNSLWDNTPGSPIPGSGEFLPATQNYGMWFATSAQTMFIRGCDVSGNKTQGLFFSSFSGTNVQITDCPSYNDQMALVKSGAPGSTVVFSAATYGYYGPAAFYVSGGIVQSISIGNNNTHLTSGTFLLGAGETATIFYSTAPNFTMIGT